MVQNVIMKGTGVYLPKNKIYNDYFVDHFEKMGKNVEGIMKHLVRRKRYFAGKGETSLTMAHQAANDVLKKLNMKAEELDMIVFVSDTPEYTSPTNALKLNGMLGAVNAHTVLDMNCNCIGMLMALDLVTNYAKVKTSIKKILIVGSMHVSSVLDKMDSVVFPNFGDSSVAVILENVCEEKKRGFIDSTVFTDSSFNETIQMPSAGHAKLALEDDVEERDRKLEWNPFDFGFLSDKWHDIIKRLLKRNNLDPNQIDHYIFSQFSDPDNMKTLEKLGVGEDKYFYVGMEYGYTGVTSPILALNRMWGTIMPKDKYIIFCSVAAGYSMEALLYKVV